MMADTMTTARTEPARPAPHDPAELASRLRSLSNLPGLLEEVIAATAPSRLLDAKLVSAIDGRDLEEAMRDWRIPRLTASVDTVNALFARILPHWWISSGQCSLGPHASCAPEGRAFEAAGLPYPAVWDEGIHVDFGHPAPEACARVAVMLKALIATQGGSAA